MTVDSKSKCSCVYCHEVKDAELFNREHVIQESMGKFEPNNLVLTTVCEECNKEFGKVLDGILGRDSFEALLRFKYGIKPISRLGELGKKRLILKVPPECGEWSGAYVELYENNGEQVARPLAQIGFYNSAISDYEFLRYEELKDFSFANRQELAPNNFKILSSTEEDEIKLKDLLHKAGWNPTIHGELGSPSRDPNYVMDIQINYTIDRRMKRAIAKIGFNYLLYILESKGMLKLLNYDSVQALRRYIRYDEGANFDPVEVLADPILDIDTKNVRHTDSHLITLGWFFYPNGRKDLEVLVSPFNRITYRITLIPNYPERPLPDITSGHQFDISVTPRQCRPLLVRDHLVLSKV